MAVPNVSRAGQDRASPPGEVADRAGHAAHAGAPDPVPGNGLLIGLPADVRDRIAPLFERVSISARKIIVQPNEPITHLWFPVTAVFSIITMMPDGRAVEVGTAGPEGMVGISVLLGVDSMPRQVFAQIAGEVLRIDRSAFLSALERHPDFRIRLLRYAQAYIDDVAQSVACNRLHTLEQRCARWILKTHDRVRGDYLPLTQQFLAFMLGVRRAGVSVAAESLQRAGLIRYQRGKVTVLDRDGLEEISCPCYRINRENFLRIMGDDRGA
jgi:CRP-like cAMP-binding protein